MGGAIAEAAPATPGPGGKATPNPIKATIKKSDIAVELVAFSTPKASASASPRALLQMLYPLGDGSGRLFVNDARGKLWELDKNTDEATLFFDVSAAAGVKLLVIAGAFPGTMNSGFRGFAFHPDFSKSGRPAIAASTRSPVRSRRACPRFPRDSKGTRPRCTTF